MEKVRPQKRGNLEKWAGVLVGVDLSVLILGVLCFVSLRWLQRISPELDLRSMIQVLRAQLGETALLDRSFLIWSTVAQFLALAACGLVLAWKIRGRTVRAILLVALSLGMALAIYPSLLLIELLV